MKSILNFAALQIGTEIAKATRACTAKAMAEFNAPPVDVCRSIGMYPAEGPNRFVRSGLQEPESTNGHRSIPAQRDAARETFVKSFPYKPWKAQHL